MFILLKPSSEARWAGTPPLPQQLASLAGFFPACLPARWAAGQHARQHPPPGEELHLQKKKNKTPKQIVLFCLKFHHVNILFQHGMKQSVNNPEFSTKQKYPFLDNFSHNVYACC